MQVNWQAAVALIGSFLASLFAAYRWITRQAERRHEAHAERFRDHRARIERTEQLLVTTRDEMHQHYVHVSQLIQLRKESREDFQLIFDQLKKMSRDLHVMMGHIHGVHDEHADL